MHVRVSWCVCMLQELHSSSGGQDHQVGGYHGSMGPPWPNSRHCCFQLAPQSLEHYKRPAATCALGVCVCNIKTNTVTGMYFWPCVLIGHRVTTMRSLSWSPTPLTGVSCCQQATTATSTSGTSAKASKFETSSTWWVRSSRNLS